MMAFMPTEARTSLLLLLMVAVPCLSCVRRSPDQPPIADKPPQTRPGITQGASGVIPAGHGIRSAALSSKDAEVAFDTVLEALERNEQDPEIFDTNDLLKEVGILCKDFCAIRTGHVMLLKPGTVARAEGDPIGRSLVIVQVERQGLQCRIPTGLCVVSIVGGAGGQVHLQAESFETIEDGPHQVLIGEEAPLAKGKSALVLHYRFDAICLEDAWDPGPKDGTETAKGPSISQYQAFLRRGGQWIPLKQGGLEIIWQDPGKRRIMRTELEFLHLENLPSAGLRALDLLVHRSTMKLEASDGGQAPKDESTNETTCERISDDGQLLPLSAQELAALARLQKTSRLKCE